MKLVVSRLDEWKGFVSREFYHVMTDLVARHGWRHIEGSRLWRGRGTVRATLLREFGELPEVVLFWEGYDAVLEHAPDVTRLDSRKCFFADDLHAKDKEEEQLKFLCFLMCDTVLSPYAYAFDHHYPRLAGMKRVGWVPHAASPDFMLDYNERPANAILLSGCLVDHYPFRRQMKQLHDRHVHAIDYHAHPGYQIDFDYERDPRVGRAYAEKLRGYRAGFTDGTWRGYVVAKYFEIPATGALLLADDTVSAQLRELGLFEHEHYLPVSPRDLEEKVRFVLDERNHDEIDRIRRSGQAVVRERHQTSDRARLIDELCAA